MPYNNHQLKRFARQMRNNPTDAEQTLWQHIRKGQLDSHGFTRQHVIGNAILDFACPTSKLAIELDGGQHDQNRHADALRTQRVNQSGYKVIRFWNNRVLTNTDGVIYEIRQALNKTNTTP